MIDYHCHLLPALDDGPEAIDESLDMARELAAFGFTEVHCTPHCIAGQYELSPVEVREALRKLQARLDLAGIALELRPGMEYYLDDYFERFAANLLPLGESRLVLCEAPPQAPPELIAEMASLIVVQGFIPLVAHPERSEPIWQMLEEQEQDSRVKGQGSRVKDQEARGKGQDASHKAQESRGETPESRWWQRLFSRSTQLPADDASRLTPHGLHGALELPDACLYQANLGAFTGYYGPLVQRRAYELLQRGVYSCFASDLHDARSAAPLLEQARGKLDFNPALQKLAAFVAPPAEGSGRQLGFW